MSLKVDIRLIFIMTMIVVFVEGEEDVGWMSKMRNFLGELGHIAGEVGNGVERLSRQIKSVEEFLDATVDEDCFFQCPKDAAPHPRKGHVPSSNGCGSYGIEEYLKGLPMNEFISCCDSHDLCYEKCGEDRDDCDVRFKKCLYAQCRQLNMENVSKLKFRGCQAGAKLLYTGTTAVGCKPYLEAQAAACECIPGKKTEF